MVERPAAAWVVADFSALASRSASIVSTRK